MASVPLDAEDCGEKQKWAGSRNVYMRKLHNKGTHAPKTGSRNNNNNDFNAHGINSVQNNKIDASQQSSRTPVVTEEGNSSQPRNLSQVGAALDDSSNLRRLNPALPSGFEPCSGNGVTGILRADNKIRINNLLTRTKSDIRGFRRKLIGELDLVRSLSKRLESRELKLDEGSCGHSQEPVGVLIDKDGGFGVGSGVGSAGLRDSRPFQELSVSVLDNSHELIDSMDKVKRAPKADQYYLNSGFLLRKGKFPPPGSNEKFNPKKHDDGEARHGVGDKYMARLFKCCGNLLSKLMKHQHGWVFNAPVDVKGLGLHDYHTIIKHPMDLGTVKSKLSKNWYKSPREFAEDVRLTFHNAMTYNPKGQDVHVMAEELSLIFEEKWAAIESEYDLYLRHGMSHKGNWQAPKSSLAPHLPQQHPSGAWSLGGSSPMSIPLDPGLKSVSYPPMGRMAVLRKPKAKDPHKRNMTYEEKQTLNTNLQSLPSEKLDDIVQIIKKRNLDLCQHDDEIEVDIDNVDAETLWELDRFLTNYKKGASKHQGKAELSPNPSEGAGRTDQETNPVSAAAVATKGKTDENPVSSSVQREKQGGDANHLSGSSSSSSDSESSAGDTDSDSSSAHGSDGEPSPKA